MGKLAAAIVGRAAPLAAPELASPVDDDNEPLHVGPSANSPKRTWWELVEARDCPLSPPQRHVATVMARITDERCVCYLSVAQIVERTGWGKSTVQGARKALVASGFFTVVGRTPHGRAMYALAFPGGLTVTPPGSHTYTGGVYVVPPGGLRARPELPVSKRDLQQSRTSVAALVDRSLQSAGDPPSAEVGFDTVSPAGTTQATAAPLTAEGAAALDRLLARLPPEQTDENSRTTFERFAADLAPHQLDQAGEELEARIANGEAFGDPVRHPAKFLCSIVKRIRDENVDRRRTREAPA